MPVYQFLQCSRFCSLHRISLNKVVAIVLQFIVEFQNVIRCNQINNRVGAYHRPDFEGYVGCVSSHLETLPSSLCFDRAASQSLWCKGRTSYTSQQKFCWDHQNTQDFFFQLVNHHEGWTVAWSTCTTQRNIRLAAESELQNRILGSHIFLHKTAVDSSKRDES